jgi:hypothetical protein
LLAATDCSGASFPADSSSYSGRKGVLAAQVEDIWSLGSYQTLWRVNAFAVRDLLSLFCGSAKDHEIHNFCCRVVDGHSGLGFWSVLNHESRGTDCLTSMCHDRSLTVTRVPPRIYPCLSFALDEPKNNNNMFRTHFPNSPHVLIRAGLDGVIFLFLSTLRSTTSCTYRVTLQRWSLLHIIDISPHTFLLRRCCCQTLFLIATKLHCDDRDCTLAKSWKSKPS